MRIGEVARRSGVSARMLRHYESIGLLEPSERTSAGYREYSDADIGRIFHIEGLRRLGMSLAEVREVLDDPSFDTTRLLGDLIAKTRERIDAEERLILDRRDHGRVLVTDVRVHQLRGEVEELPPLAVDDRRPLRPDHRRRVDETLGRPGVEDVRAVEGMGPGGFVLDRCEFDIV